MDFKETEKKILKFWESNKIYKFSGNSKGKIYSIDTPPPTVSGKMHIGHAFSYSQEDFIARFKRMKEGQVFYPFGTDDNGLPTERLIEKLNKVNSKKMSRKEFIKLCLKSLKEITPDFVQDWKNLGVSADYDMCYSTIDRNSQMISQKSFIELYKKKRIYKKDFPTLWCPVCQTAIAQAELEDKDLPSNFLTLKFYSEDKVLPIATTRPELLGACVAVFVNPKDRRYKKFIGKNVRVPLFNHEVRIFSDESADMEKGTGALMVCSYGDKYDVDATQRHNLIPRVIFNRDGSVNSGIYSGMKIKEARKKIIEDLEKNDLVTEKKQISHAVNVHDKCGTEIEFIPTEQWFVKILDLKKKLVSQGKEIKWHPEFMFKRYKNWVDGLDWDWAISRDRHFGIPIPVWECKKCKKIILPKESELPVDPLETKKKCSSCNEEAIPEEKVLDTWATSSLTPQIASSLVKNKIKIPYSLRPQAHDIIRTWAFYTIVKSYLHEGKIPWNNVMISGFVTLGKEKMSKSKGNVISPQEVMEKYGSDALRFWAAGSKLGEDLDYQEKDLVTGKRFVTKLMNASKFVFMNLKGFDGNKPKKLIRTDETFLELLQNLVNNYTNHFEGYGYSKAKQEIEQFFWQDFADNYLEIVKRRVYQGSKEEKASAQYTLYQSLLTILKLIAPIMPFVTEEIYQERFKKTEKDKSIHLSSLPKMKKISSEAIKEWVILKKDISFVRQEKSKNKLPLNYGVLEFNTPHAAVISKYENDFMNVSGLQPAGLAMSEEEYSVKFPKESTEQKV